MRLNIVAKLVSYLLPQPRLRQQALPGVEAVADEVLYLLILGFISCALHRLLNAGHYQILVSFEDTLDCLGLEIEGAREAINVMAFSSMKRNDQLVAYALRFGAAQLLCLAVVIEERAYEDLVLLLLVTVLLR